MKKNDKKRLLRFFTRVNWPAVLLALLLMLVLWYCLADFVDYYEVMQKRAQLADEVSMSINEGKLVDAEQLRQKQADIQDEMDGLAANTDLGEFFAQNANTEDGKGVNCLIMIGYVIVAIVVGGVILLNTIRLVVWIIWSLFFKEKKETERSAAQAAK